MPDVLFPTAKAHPRLHEDDYPLLEELARREITFRCAVWDDPNLDWGSAPIAVIRSTWDYHRRRDEFVAWAKRAAGKTALHNPAPILEWNTDKRYLQDLEKRGIAIVPTAWFERGSRPDLSAIARERGWDAVVVKPVVSGGAYATVKAEPAEFAKGQAHLDALLSVEHAMVQPYQRAVEGHGERSLLFFDGALSHSVRKQSAFAPQTAEADPARFSEEEERAAKIVLAEVARIFPGEGTNLLYARVDIVPDERGTWRLMEVELTEPTLFFREGGAASVKRMCDGIERRLRAHGRAG